MASPNQHSSELPSLAPENALHDANLPPEHLVYDRGNLSNAVDDRALESGVYALDDPFRGPPSPHGPPAGFAAECRRGGSTARRGHSRVGEHCPVLDRGGKVDGARECWSIVGST